MRLEHGLGRAATPKLERVNVQIPLRVSSVILRGTTRDDNSQEQEIDAHIYDKTQYCLHTIFRHLL